MKVLEGIIVSTKMEKTAVVEVYSKTPHPMYGKLIKTSKKHKADTTGFEAKVGQRVRIAETRPLSSDKKFKIIELIEEVVGTKKTATTETPKLVVARKTTKKAVQKSSNPTSQKLRGARKEKKN
ncbi:MAG: 30S ribosomal protein S17 [Candidatus Levybacteria bacterium RIFCSPLOWO2_01_FULL_39_10]|nr:MAG: 30S ribosomal protein S17 [Candidatus Levybacteria bacterium RIFCSPLOWO2_01_FULL_39_10]